MGWKMPHTPDTLAAHLTSVGVDMMREGKSEGEIKRRLQWIIDHTQLDLDGEDEPGWFDMRRKL